MSGTVHSKYSVIHSQSTVYCSQLKYSDNMYNVWYCTFEVLCTSLTKYTVVNGSTVIVCKLNNVRYCGTHEIVRLSHPANPSICPVFLNDAPITIVL